MSNVQLTAGVCRRFVESEDAAQKLEGTPLLLQVLSIKKVGAGQAPTDRFRLILSDGEHFLQSMLATQLNHTVTDGLVTKHSIINVDNFTWNVVQDRRLLIVLGFRTIADVHEKIGNPTALQDGSTRPTPAPGAVPNVEAATTEVAASSSSVAPPRQGQGNRAGRGAAIFPIEALSPYQNHWTIKARVTFKSEIKTWANARGEGKLFYATFMDETGEIRGTAFNAIVDELYDKIEEGKVYYISKARVNLAKKKFSNIANDFELALERHTEIEECHDTQVPAIKYNFVTLSGLLSLAKDSICDVIGVVKEVGDIGSITSAKFNKTSTKRELTLVDRSGFSVRLTLWGKQAEQYSGGDQPVIAFKGVKVGDFGAPVRWNSIPISPKHMLSGDGTMPVEIAKLSKPIPSHLMMLQEELRSAEKKLTSLLDLRESQIGMSDTAEYFSARATIMHIKPDNIAYAACPKAGCNKKLFEQHDGWRCEKCDQSFERPEYRYIISMAVADYSNQAWFQGFNDLGVALFNRPADEVMEFKTQDESRFNKVIESVIGTTHNFTCRAKSDTYNESTRVRYGVQKISPLDYTEESHYLKELLSSPWAQ